MTLAKLRFESVLLLLFFANVSVPVLAGSNSITNIQLSPTSPATLVAGDRVDVSFDYQTDEAGGVLIFPRPFTNGSQTPGYGASGSPPYPVGSGVGSSWFVVRQETTVDQIRFQMTDISQSNLILEIFVPVEYRYSQPAAIIPTTSQWSLILLALLLGMVGIARVRRQV